MFQIHVILTFYYTTFSTVLFALPYATLPYPVPSLGRVRDEREAEMVTLEKDLVSILVEQQKVVLSFVEQGRVAGERIKDMMKVWWSKNARFKSP